MPEQWHGKIQVEYLILDTEAAAWMVYDRAGRWQGTIRASRKLPQHINHIDFHCRDGRHVEVDVKQRTEDHGKSVLNVVARLTETAG